MGENINNIENEDNINNWDNIQTIGGAMNAGAFQTAGGAMNTEAVQTTDGPMNAGAFQTAGGTMNTGAPAAPRPKFTTSLIEKIMAFAIIPISYIYVLIYFASGDEWKIFFGVFVLLFICLGEAFYWNRKRTVESFLFLSMTIAGAVATVFSIGSVWEEGMTAFFTHLFAAYWILCRSGRLAQGETSHLFIWDGMTAFFVMPFKNYWLDPRSIGSVFSKKDKGEKKKTGVIIATLILGIILLIMAVSILRNADDNYNELLSNITSYIRIDGEFVWKLIFTGFMAFYFYGLTGGCYRETEAQVQHRGDNINRFVASLRKVPYIVWVILIGLFTVFYIMFFALQGAYLWDAFSFNLPTQYTFSEYARRGFGDMCWVMVIDFIVWWFASRTSENMSKALKSACAVLNVESILFAVIAGLKIIMYIHAYGFTPLRLQSIWLVFVLLYACVCVLVNMFTEKKTAKWWFIISAASLAVLCLI